MRMSLGRGSLGIVGSLAFAGVVLLADGSRFSEYVPLAGSAGGAGRGLKSRKQTTILFERREIRSTMSSDFEADGSVEAVGTAGSHFGRARSTRGCESKQASVWLKARTERARAIECRARRAAAESASRREKVARGT